MFYTINYPCLIEVSEGIYLVRREMMNVWKKDTRHVIPPVYTLSEGKYAKCFTNPTLSCDHNGEQAKAELEDFLLRCQPKKR